MTAEGTDTPSGEDDEGASPEATLSSDAVDEATLAYLYDFTREVAELDQKNLSSNNQLCGFLLAFTGLVTTLAGKDLLPHLPCWQWLDPHRPETYVFWAAAIAGGLAVATGICALRALRPLTAEMVSPQQTFLNYAEGPAHEVKFQTLNSVVQTQVQTRIMIARRIQLGSKATVLAVCTLAMTLLAAILKATL